MIETLILAAVLFCVLVLVPLMILGVLFKFLFFLILLPFKLIKGLLGLLFGAAGLVLKFVLLMGLVLLVPFLLFGGAILIALLPFLLLALLVGGLIRLLRPRASVQPAV